MLTSLKSTSIDALKRRAAPSCPLSCVQDPRTNNPTYQIFYPENETLSTPLVLTILMESNPVNTYPFAIVMPTGSTLIIAGESLQHLGDSLISAPRMPEQPPAGMLASLCFC